MASMYICKKRVVKNGKLAAFEGQMLTEEEAISLGLVDNAKEQGGAKKKPTKAELVEQALALGIKAPSNATVAAIEQLIADAQAANAGETTGTHKAEQDTEGKDKAAQTEPED